MKVIKKLFYKYHFYIFFINKKRLKKNYHQSITGLSHERKKSIWVAGFRL